MTETISAEKLAYSFELCDLGQIPDFKRELRTHPKIRELLWYLESQFSQDGGPGEFVDRFVNRFRDYIGTPTLRGLIAQKVKTLTPKHAGEILNDLSSCGRSDQWSIVEALNEAAHIDIPFPTSEMHEKFCDLARSQLPATIANMCNYPAVNFNINVGAWYLPELPRLLMRTMEIHQLEVAGQIAKTAVACKVFDALDYGLSESEFVMISGNSRFGKTESLSNWCAQRPGAARLVTVPYCDTERSFFEAIGAALGVEFFRSTTLQELRGRIEAVLEASRIMLVFDEAHFLFPHKFTKTTPPNRLNWIRTAVVDKGLPCAIAVTPQAYQHSRRQYISKTGFVIEQFTGRIGHCVALPEKLSDEDLMAVAKIHFPEFGEEILLDVVDVAGGSGSFLKAVKNISKRARFFAKQSSRAVRASDIDKAIEEQHPEFAPKPTPALSRETKVADRSPRTISSRVTEEDSIQA